MKSHILSIKRNALTSIKRRLGWGLLVLMLLMSHSAAWSLFAPTFNKKQGILCNITPASSGACWKVKDDTYQPLEMPSKLSTRKMVSMTIGDKRNVCFLTTGGSPIC